MKLNNAAIRLTARLLSIIIIVSLLLTCTSLAVLADTGISLSSSSGAPGTSITVTGIEFGDSEVVTISFDGSTLTTAIATAAGFFSAPITIPASAYGAHTIAATGAVSGQLTAPFNTTKKVTWSKTSGSPGTSVTLTGAGFGAYDSITVKFESETVLTDTASSVGAWSEEFDIPDSASGSHTISIKGTISGTTYDTFKTTPKISLDKNTGAPGSTVTVSGAGFGDEETDICITFDGDVLTSGITADEDGSWSSDFTVPAGSSGSHYVGAYGDDNDEEDISTVKFTIGAGITLNNTGGIPGNTITVTGAGFKANETGICITFDGVTVSSGISANSSGGWSGNFTVPAATSGSHYVGAYGAVNTADKVGTVTLTIGAGISLNKTSGVPGTSITVTGAGFNANETGISVTFDGEPAASDISANSSGGWTVNFIIPAAASGSHSIQANGTVGTTSSVSFSVAATISIGTAAGAPGSTVTVTGTGFGANETGISIIFDSITIATGIIADSSGSWTAEITIPPLASGAHSISASGLVTQSSPTSISSFNVTAGIVLNPANGYVDSDITVSGYGFAANSDIRLTYDNTAITLLNATTDASGSMSQQITIPVSAAGSHSIAVTDLLGNTAKASFIIGDTPPAAPVPTSPTDNKTIGLIGNATPTFKWSAVDDPNGVTYQLQIDTNPEFAYPIINKTGIQANYYTLYSYESLPLGTYYWRVKAINNASVESEWSMPRTVKSGLMAPWILALIIVAAAAAIGLGIYYGIIRTVQRKREAITVSEVEIPMGGGQWQGLELPEETTRERRAPPRLALPEVSRSSKTMATEDQARLKVIVEFAQSIPLAEPDYNVKWLENVLESQVQTQISAPIYDQLLKGEIQIRYEPSWVRHPIFKDLTAVLHKHPILHKLEAFVIDIERNASEAMSVIQQVYRESKSDLPQDFLERGGWGFLTAVYTDAVNWYAGKSLYDPAERDYKLEIPNGGKEDAQCWLSGEGNTSFAGHLILARDEKEALDLRNIHLRLRRTWRNSEKVRQVTSAVTQLQLQRNELLNAFSQIGRAK
ncbi:MAG: IPT/TIG domain-containing protein [Dehalococcoidales bacterium]|nr:IPT/TIG domain-containing protein [Dehalococcoidales bacterium]